MPELTLWSIDGMPVNKQHKISISADSVRAVRDVSAYGLPMKSEVTTNILDMRYSEGESQVTNFNTVYEVIETYADIMDALKKDGWK